MAVAQTRSQLTCYHCGESCGTTPITWEEKPFCCEGCKLVFQLLNQHGLCDYYTFNTAPGINRKRLTRQDKFAFLEDPQISKKLVTFQNEDELHFTFYLPQIHCSSCLYLLEQLHQIEPGILHSKVNFPRKEVSLVLHTPTLSLRQAAEVLTSIGYEPYISLHDLQSPTPRIPRQQLYQLGVAGFCFANIMLLSFPEYLGLNTLEQGLHQVFRFLNVGLSLPVFFYSALPFFTSGWKSIQLKRPNIDAPIALAIIVTFCRSLYEVLSGSGSGYFDSMTGIVFFMLIGRMLQEKTYQQLSFERDYTHYFPIAVTVVKENTRTTKALPDLHTGDTLLIRNEELIPADGILTRGHALIDYSFVTGESTPVAKEMGEIIYAGGKQVGGSIELLVIKEVTQSYLTQLWSAEPFKGKQHSDSDSFVQLLSRYFTWIVLLLATSGAVYWSVQDPSRIWNVVTAVLIVACPCALLLSNTFTNGNILRILSRNKFYLRNAQVIEDLAEVNHIVFDKTGTLTQTQSPQVTYTGEPLDTASLNGIIALARQSQHPLSRVLADYYPDAGLETNLQQFRELAGKGIQGYAAGQKISLGSRPFITGNSTTQASQQEVWVAIQDQVRGFFTFQHQFRPELPALFRKLSRTYSLALLSGDQDGERELLQQVMGPRARLYFHQQPQDKLAYIRALEKEGHKVLMIGDGLNDAGALKESTVGIAVSENTNTFTPASDAILEASRLSSLPRFIELCQNNRQIVLFSFLLSIVYNVVGLSFALQGRLSPMVAAILMPISSITIVLVTFGSSTILARRLGL